MRPFRFWLKRCVVMFFYQRSSVASAFITENMRLETDSTTAPLQGRSHSGGRLTPLPASNSKSVESPLSLPSFYSLYSLSSMIPITLLPVCVQTDCPPPPTRLSFCSATLSCLSKPQANSLSQHLFPPRQYPLAVTKCRIGSDLRRTAGTSSLGKCEMAWWNRLEGPTQGCAVKPCLPL